jgi:plastocyanin
MTQHMKAALSAGWACAWLWVVPALMAGDCVIEGSVKFPVKTGAPALSAAAAGRYKSLPPGAVGAAPLAAAVIYLQGEFPAGADDQPPTVQVGQKQFQFVPALLAVRKGTRVEFPNQDDEYHNVLSYSKAKEFDLGRYLKSEKPPVVVFDKAGVVELNCEIHEHMRGYVVVLDTPHFTTTEAEGRFRLAGLPPGKYTLKAWLNPKTIWQQPVELAAGAVLRVNFAPP